jgi:hypothetical protein
MGDGRREAFQAKGGDRRAVNMARDAQRHRGRQMRRARHITRRPHRHCHGLDGGSIAEAEHQQSLFGFRFGQGLDRHLGQDCERAPGTGHELAQVITGDIFYHTPAGLDGLAASGHGLEAEEMIARRTRLDPSRTGKVCRQHAADGPFPHRPAEDRPIVHGLERERLAFGRHQGFDLGDRRTGAGRQYQLFRLVKRDPREAGQIERDVGLAGAADGAL